MDHRLAATPQTVRFGMFDAAFPPVLTIEAGDRVEIQTVSGGPEVMPDPSSGLRIPEALAAIHAAHLERIGPHILTGPIAIRGAEPGDMLEVGIESISPGNDWGYCAIRPLAGVLPDEFPERFVSHIAVDPARGVCRPTWGPELTLAPFFGTMGVSPPAAYGRLSSREPREHGGNIDNRELVAGSTLYLPVWLSGANFSAGDGHGRQGDGEVCVNALEMGLNGSFTFRLHKGGGVSAPLLRYPRAETPSHYISMGFHETLDEALRRALREMIALVCERSALSRREAYQLCSLAVDFRITQAVNGEKGIHGMLRKGLLF
jgi:acetamidase/formamidase